ncbi:hypothetical protein [Salinicola avicenniae]|uniref:hypothetical protein n=1 Tax=Salinicola avicenniae TaxID=2916836 RepID=UPI002072F2A4|nr:MULTISPECIES: hypothetical protein [unclassified Salinicola]
MSDHRAVDYITRKWGGQNLTAQTMPAPLSRLDALELEEILKEDAVDYFNSGVVSLCDALGRAEQKAWSWCTVKLYYAVFYFAKSFLAMERYMVFFYQDKPAWLKAEPGAQGKRFRGQRPLSHSDQTAKKNVSGSHSTALYLFESSFGSSVLMSQDVDSFYPTAWMMEQREYANYRLRGFPDPYPPRIFGVVDKIGIRKAIATYLSDRYFAFDKDHAVIAYPLLFMMEVRKKMATNNNYEEVFDEEKVSLLRRLAKDSNGPLELIINSVLPNN